MGLRIGEWEWERVQVMHASYTINVPLNNFNIHGSNTHDWVSML